MYAKRMGGWCCACNTLLYLEEVVWHIKNLSDFSCLNSLILGSKLHIDKVTYYIFHYNEVQIKWVQIVNCMSGVCKKVIGQWYSTEAEDELLVNPCLGFYNWAYSAHRSSMSERYFGCRACAVLLHNCLLTSNLKMQSKKKLYKS